VAGKCLRRRGISSIHMPRECAVVIWLIVVLSYGARVRADIPWPAGRSDRLFSGELALERRFGVYRLSYHESLQGRPCSHELPASSDVCALSHSSYHGSWRVSGVCLFLPC